MAVESQWKQKMLGDLVLVERIRNGDESAWALLITMYKSFIKLKASSYFIYGGDQDDLMQEGLMGFCKAVRDYRDDRGASFRSFAELCITRQIITAIKTASRQKHQPLNSYLSLNHSPVSHGDNDCTLGDTLPTSRLLNPLAQIIAEEELIALADKLCNDFLTDLEATVLLDYIQGLSYEEIAENMGSDTKSVDNALQRIKRKVELHLKARDSFLLDD